MAASWAYAGVVAAPIAIVLIARRVALRTKIGLVGAAAVTWAAAAIAIGWMFPDRTAWVDAITFAIVLPCVVAPVAGAVASSLIDRRERWSPAIASALVGCVIGELIGWIVTPPPAHGAWAHLVAAAPPVSYASALAAITVGRG